LAAASQTRVQRSRASAAGRRRGARAMSGFWSTWVMVLACVTAGLSLLLFVWGITMRIPTQADGTTGHVWAHGVLREGVRPLPRSEERRVGKECRSRWSP